MGQLIFTLIPKIMTEVSAVGKNSRNEFQKYNFRGIDDIYNMVHPILAANGVFCVPQVTRSKTEVFEGKDGKRSFRVILRVAHLFCASDGSHVEVITQGEGIDTSDKASSKAMTAAMKYAFIELLSLHTEDIEDADKHSPEIDSDSHIKTIKLSPKQTNAEKIEITPKALQLSDYVVQLGQYKSQRLGNIPPEDLDNYLSIKKDDYEKLQLIKDPTDVQLRWLEFFDKANRYLDSLVPSK